jgi:hypothetical protein
MIEPAIPVYVVFTFTARNIFINAFLISEKGYVPIMFQTSGSQLYTEEYAKGHHEQLTEFAYAAGDWLRRWEAPSVFILFRGLGVVFKKRHQTSANLDNKRALVLDELHNVDLPIEAFYDISPVSFNGCKTQKKRRKKKKHMTREEINALKNDKKKRTK